jgi:Tfp pilus assembly PilM family ATPase
MTPMFRFLQRKPLLGIEITSSELRLTPAGRNGDVPVEKTAGLAAGLVKESYEEPNIAAFDRVSGLLRQALAGISAPPGQRASLSLPDGVFRIQALDFDSLPARAADRGRLIRWRLEKAAVDLADTVLRCQVLPRHGEGVSVLACLAKRNVISQYEALIAGQGLEPWVVAPSSFHILNRHSSHITRGPGAAALAHVREGSFAILIVHEGVRFYRYKDMTRTAPDGSKARLMREIEDSLHFYSHRDRSRQAEVKDLYLAGDHAMTEALAAGFGSVTSLNVEVLAPFAFARKEEAGPTAGGR